MKVSTGPAQDRPCRIGPPQNPHKGPGSISDRPHKGPGSISGPFAIRDRIDPFRIQTRPDPVLRFWGRILNKHLLYYYYIKSNKNRVHGYYSILPKPSSEWIRSHRSRLTGLCLTLTHTKGNRTGFRPVPDPYITEGPRTEPIQFHPRSICSVWTVAHHSLPSLLRWRYIRLLSCFSCSGFSLRHLLLVSARFLAFRFAYSFIYSVRSLANWDHLFSVYYL